MHGKRHADRHAAQHAGGGATAIGARVSDTREGWRVEPMGRRDATQPKGLSARASARSATHLRVERLLFCDRPTHVTKCFSLTFVHANLIIIAIGQKQPTSGYSRSHRVSAGGLGPPGVEFSSVTPAPSAPDRSLIEVRTKWSGQHDSSREIESFLNYLDFI